MKRPFRSLTSTSSTPASPAIARLGAPVRLSYISTLVPARAADPHDSATEKDPKHSSLPGPPKA